MPAYIQSYFIEQLRGSAYPYTFVLSVAMVLLLLAKWERSWRALPVYAAEFAALLAVRLVIDCLLEPYISLQWLDLLAEAVLLVAYAKARSGLRVETWLVRSAVYLSFTVINMGFSEAVGRYMDELQFRLFGLTYTTVVTLVLSLALAAFLRCFSVETFSYVPRFCVMLILVISVLGAAIEVYPITTMDPANDYTSAFRTYNLCVCASFLALETLAYYMFYSLSREYSEKTDLLAQQHKAELDADVLLTAQQTYNNLREVRHEIKNHDAYMKALLDSGEYDKLRDYFERNTAHTADLLRTVQTGNHIVDAIINNRITRAKMYDIEVQTMLAVPPQLSFEEGDLCSLLSNLMDNAIEGCAASGTQGKARVIAVSIRPQNGYFFVRVTNPAPAGMRTGAGINLHTTKQNLELHGNGIKIIRRIADKYHGAAKFNVENGQFVADVMLAADTQKGAA